jgi:hypothetical protein
MNEQQKTHISLHIFPSPMFKSEFPSLFCDPLGEVVAAFEPSVRGPDEEGHDIV